MTRTNRVFLYAVFPMFLSLTIFLISFGSSGFNRFFKEMFGVHPLIVTVILSALAILLALYSNSKSPDFKSSLIHMIAVIIAILTFIAALIVYAIGDFAG